MARFRVAAVIATCGVIAGLSVAGVPSTAVAKDPPKPLQDWPCDTPFAGPLEPDMLWPGASAQMPPEGAWEGDPIARELVDFLTAGENSPGIGQREIEDRAQKNGPFRREVSLRVVSGMVERANSLRRILLEGIKQQIIKSHVLATAIEENTSQLAAARGLPKDQASSDPARQPAALETARTADLRMLDDTDDMAEHLCHRLVYDETKLRQLATSLQSHTAE